jgi:hypothetical protein
MRRLPPAVFPIAYATDAVEYDRRAASTPLTAADLRKAAAAPDPAPRERFNGRPADVEFLRAIEPADLAVIPILNEPPMPYPSSRSRRRGRVKAESGSMLAPALERYVKGAVTAPAAASAVAPFPAAALQPSPSGGAAASTTEAAGGPEEAGAGAAGAYAHSESLLFDEGGPVDAHLLGRFSSMRLLRGEYITVELQHAVLVRGHSERVIGRCSCSLSLE